MFLLGTFVGHVFTTSDSSTPASASNANMRGENNRAVASSGVYRLSETPVRNTAHKDKHGRPITKQQFLEPFAVPTVAGFSVATLHPGQSVETHQHESMHEFFYIIEGTGFFYIGNDKVPVSPGTFLHFAPQQPHGIVVPEDSTGGDLKMLLSGVVPRHENCVL